MIPAGVILCVLGLGGIVIGAVILRESLAAGLTVGGLGLLADLVGSAVYRVGKRRKLAKVGGEALVMLANGASMDQAVDHIRRGGFKRDLAEEFIGRMMGEIQKRSARESE